MEAAARTRSRIPVVIAGHGSQLAELQALAQRLDAPVRFAGQIDEGELIALYEGALAVVYAPFDEDYGYGVLEGFEVSGPAAPLLLKSPFVQGISVGHRRALEDFVRAVDQLRLKPVIDRRYAFEELPQALDHLNRGPFGKVVVEF